MKLEGEINYYTLAFLWESPENVEYFINNFNRLLENTKSMDINLIGGLCYISEVKDIIIENLAEIIKKTTPREGIFDIFSSELCKQYVSDFLVKVHQILARYRIMK